jgi:hypothetical protein
MAASTPSNDDGFNPRKFFNTLHHVMESLTEVPRFFSDWTLARLCQQIDSDYGKALLTSGAVVPSRQTRRLVSLANPPGVVAETKALRAALLHVLPTFPFRPHTIPLETLISRISSHRPQVVLSPRLAADQLFDNLLDSMEHLASVCMERVRPLLAAAPPKNSELAKWYATTRPIDLMERAGWSALCHYQDPQLPPETKERWFEHITAATLLLGSEARLTRLHPTEIATTLALGSNALLELIGVAPPFPDVYGYVQQYYGRIQRDLRVANGTDGFHFESPPPKPAALPATVPLLLTCNPETATDPAANAPQEPPKPDPGPKTPRLRIRKTRKWPGD